MAKKLMSEKTKADIKKKKKREMVEKAKAPTSKKAVAAEKKKGKGGHSAAWDTRRERYGKSGRRSNKSQSTLSQEKQAKGNGKRMSQEKKDKINYLKAYKQALASGFSERVAHALGEHSMRKTRYGKSSISKKNKKSK